jgi:hypothetical protein
MLSIKCAAKKKNEYLNGVCGYNMPPKAGQTNIHERT